VSIYTAPARATDLSALPQTWIEVGSADLLRDEDVIYGTKLSGQGVLVEMHVWPGAWRGFDSLALSTTLTETCLAARLTG
jgi:acetyl esterase/lipase